MADLPHMVALNIAILLLSSPFFRWPILKSMLKSVLKKALLKWGRWDPTFEKTSNFQISVKQICTQFSGAYDGAHTKVEFLNACIKRFGEKDVMNEIKK